MREAEGFDVFLKARRYNPLVPPELVTLQIRSHFREGSFDLHELWAHHFVNLLTGLSPFGHDTVEEEDEFLGVDRDIPTGLIRYRRQGRGVGVGKRKRRWVRVLVEWELCVLTLTSFSLVS